MGSKLIAMHDPFYKKYKCHSLEEYCLSLKNSGAEMTACPCKFMAELGDSGQFNVFITKPPHLRHW